MVRFAQKYQNLAVSYGINADDILKNPTKTKLVKCIKLINDKEGKEILKISGKKRDELKNMLCDFLELTSFVEVDPRQILYSQCCIKPNFTPKKKGEEGRRVEDTITSLVNGRTSPKEIKPIRVWTCSNGKKHSLDNRRLYAFKEAIKLGAAIDTVTVEDANKRKNLLKELKWKMKHYPSKDWSTIEIKENCNKK
ncbi:hypothetical protein RhiirC2_867549 [Rhizophagus irregularis]|uniref:Uncharacterized protein n=1 Tax=Rhizophagus irregularis TaxID=588596 RepID=A0A2N1N205_9GLOM|nr:hypothetical protein RhiirC2_867549 [Rhizophagus irregularis]